MPDSPMPSFASEAMASRTASPKALPLAIASGCLKLSGAGTSLT